MDNDKLCMSLQEQLFTDVTITLVDPQEPIIFPSNKAVLAASSPYFEKLLDDEEKKDIIVNVPNIYVAHDIIMSFYGKKITPEKLLKHKYLLEHIKCLNKFGLAIDKLSIDNIIVAEED
jgi:hypothetical protein